MVDITVEFGLSLLSCLIAFSFVFAVHLTVVES